jgi:hypothetical protein
MFIPKSGEQLEAVRVNQRRWWNPNVSRADARMGAICDAGGEMN